MEGNAWPFLIGRAKSAGYRVVVVPDFMADAASVDALSGAARDVRLPADTACVRELRGLECGPVTVVYRCFTPRPNDFGLDQEELSDGFGRPIRVTEGFVLRSAATAALPQITVADLDRTHAAVAAAYRDFWRHDRDYVRGTSTGNLLGSGESSRSRPVRLEIAEPWGRTRGTTTARVPSAAYQPGEKRSRRPGAALVIGSAVVIAGLVVAAGLLAGVLRGKPTPPAASVLGDFCHALKAGRTDTAYGFTSPRLRSTLSSAEFATELLPQGSPVTGCTYTVDSASASAAQGTVTVATGSAKPVAWGVRLALSNGTWLIENLVAGSGNTPTSGGSSAR